MRGVPIRDNRLLRALTRAQVRRLGVLEPVTLKRGEIVYRAEEPITHFVLLSSGIVSLVRQLADGKRVSAWSFDGTLIGGQTVFQVREATYDTVMRTDATGWRIARDVLDRAMAADPKLQQIILNWVHYMDTAIAISGACQAVHSIEQRLCRLLLSAAFSTRTSRVALSLPEIAVLVTGARRQFYTIAHRLQAAGGLRIARHVTEITDSAVLQARSCECFAEISHLYETAIPNR